MVYLDDYVIDVGSGLGSRTYALGLHTHVMRSSSKPLDMPIESRDIEPAKCDEWELMQDTPSRIVWELAHFVAAEMDAGRRTALYVALGAGEIYSALVGALTVVASEEIDLPGDLGRHVRMCADGYTGTGAEAVLQRLLNAAGLATGD
ncbi:hypothetical protein BA059_22710 [Mycolicibacterium sp. (ex Dasyatis americana)]|nr:hypothetical protein BA059_22710 [Mycolicibacterium sp. (ex Dasyatis americana)]